MPGVDLEVERDWEGVAAGEGGDTGRNVVLMTRLGAQNNRGRKRRDRVRRADPLERLSSATGGGFHLRMVVWEVYGNTSRSMQR